MTRLLIFLIFITFASPTYGQDYERTLDEFLFTELGKLKIPNVEISVVSSEGILYSRSFGVKKSDSDLFYLGSVSKSLTALAVLKLIESGKFDFESRLSDIIPEINYNEYANEITVRHLLNHTSGIKKIEGFENLPKLDELSSSGFSLITIEEPGNRHEYSNLNYSLLGLVIERSSGTSFLEFISYAVFEPLQMKSNRIRQGVQSHQNVVNQYKYWGPFPIKSKQIKYSETAVPSGFILSNVEDMSNYLSMMLANGNYKNERFIDPQLLNQMITPWDNSKFGYCMGWKKGNYNQKVIFQHLGSTATSYSAIFIIPESNIGFAIFTNTNSFNYTENITEGILNILTDGEVNNVAATELYFRLGILLAILLILVNLIVKVIKHFRSNQIINPKKVVISIGFNIIIIIALIYGLPRFTNVHFITIVKLQPDIGALIILGVLSPLFNNTLKTIQILKSKEWGR